MTIPDGQILTNLTLTCTPNSTELQQGELILTTNDPEFPTVSYDLYCQGLQPPTIITEPTIGSELLFDDLLIGQAGLITLTIDKQDPASAALAINTIELTGDPDFNIIVPGTDHLTITEHAQAIKIRCAPQVPGLRQGQLRLETNDPEASEIFYPLNCQGVCYNYLQAFPDRLDFQTLAINTPATLKQRIIPTTDQINPYIKYNHPNNPTEPLKPVAQK